MGRLFCSADLTPATNLLTLRAGSAGATLVVLAGLLLMLALPASAQEDGTGCPDGGLFPLAELLGFPARLSGF